jgi:hypothetical protein
MALGFPFGFRVAASQPLDNKYGPYNSTAAAIAAVVSGERYIGLTVNVSGTEYWWKDVTTDAGLVIKAVQGSNLVQFDATLANIALDFSGNSEVTFVASVPIGANKTWQLVNNGSANKLYVLFTIAGAAPETYAQVFPANFKMNNPNWDKIAKTWTTYQAGDFKATATYDGTNWWMDIEGGYN